MHTGLAARRSAVEWALPRAYQEWRPTEGALLELSQARVWAEAWETNIAIFNALDAQRMITMYQYAETRPPRPPISYPFEPWQQLVFQPGFGQGFPGGPGWARYESDGAAFYIAAESLREAEDSLQWVEGWSTTAWPRDPGAPRTIALPDLGGPAAARPLPSTPPAKRPLRLRARADGAPESR